MTRLLLAVFLTLNAVATAAGDTSPYFSCRSCHGDQGQGSAAIHAPALAGQSAEYLARQLRHFREGVRGSNSGDIWGRQMALMAANLDDAQIIAVADMIAAMPAWPQGHSTSARDVEATPLFVACTACHGAAGEGKPALNAPRISGLDSSYLAIQLRNFRDGIRGAHDKDLYGAQMRASTPPTLDEKTIDLLACYIQSM